MIRSLASLHSLRQALLATTLALAVLPATADVDRCADLAAKLLEAGEFETAFRVTADVTAVIVGDDGCLLLTLRDASGPAFTMGIPPEGAAKPAPGDRIIATGIVRNSRNASNLSTFTDLRIIGRGTPGPLQNVPLSVLISGLYDWVPVRVCGIVRDVLPSETNPNWVILILVDGQTYQYASAPLNGETLASYEPLIGSKVEVAGFCNPTDSSKRSLIGRIFQCGGREAITPIGPKITSPFDAPDVAALRHLRPSEIATVNRHRTTGCVLTVWGGKYALLSNPDGMIVRLACDRMDGLQPGDCIEASGFPQSDFFHITLTRSVWRSVSSASKADRTEKEHQLDEILSDKGRRTSRMVHFQGCRIRVTGRVHARAQATEGEDDILTIEHGADLITVETTFPSPGLRHVKPGCRVSISGVCVLETENWRYDLLFPKVKGFRIVVNDEKDVQVLSGPPWWTTGRLVGIIGALLAFLAGALGWNISLRRLAARKGRALFREQLGHVKADLRTEERTRLAVELHDTLAQNLTGVSMEIEAANDLRGAAPQAMLAHLGIAAKALKSCRDELRNCLWDLRCQALEEPDMIRAIRKTLQPSVSEAQLAVRFDVPRARLSDNTTHALLRMIRELVINASRHGAATSIRVAGALDGDRLLCSVTDNGCGFDPATAPGILQGHFGLQGIRERLTVLGGEIAIAGAPGGGTRVVISLPIPHGCDTEAEFVL